MHLLSKNGTALRAPRLCQFPSLVASTNAQREAASSFIDALDLTTEDRERQDPKMTFNPALQYFAQVVTHKITHAYREGGDPNSMGPALPPLNATIAEYVRPDREMFMQAEEEIANFDEAFELEAIEEVEGEPKKRIYWKDLIAREEQKLEKKVEEEQAERLKMGKGEDEDKAKKEISSVNPVGDFKAMIGDRKVDRVGEAISQMQKMIERFISTALKGDLFAKAIECLKELRAACI